MRENYRLHDCGYIENDQLFVTGRSDDILIQNGKNYSSTLIESLILEASENVIECASFSIPFDQESTILAAVLVLKINSMLLHMQNLKTNKRTCVFEIKSVFNTLLFCN